MVSASRLRFPIKTFINNLQLISATSATPHHCIYWPHRTLHGPDFLQRRYISSTSGASESPVHSKDIDSYQSEKMRVFILLQAAHRLRPKAAFYAVKKGRTPGIYFTWDDCAQQVNGYTGAIHKKFKTRGEAESFVDNGGASSRDPYPPAKPRRGGDKEQPSAARPESYSNLGLASVQDERPKKCTATPLQVHTADASVHPTLSSSSLEGASSSITSSPRHQLAREQGFTITCDGHLVVYTDGSSQGNGAKGAKAGSGVWWADQGHASTLNLAERLPGQPQTNNRAELLAIIRALETCPFPELPLEIRTDSQYSISCMTQFLPAWIRNDFRLSTGQPVKNKDMIVHLLALLNQRGQSNAVKFMHVRAHVGETGNEGADVLANEGAGIRDIPPDRTDWFSLDDAKRFKAGHLPDAKSSTKMELLQEGPPIEAEIDPTWLLTEDEIAELKADT